MPFQRTLFTAALLGKKKKINCLSNFLSFCYYELQLNLCKGSSCVTFLKVAFLLYKPVLRLLPCCLTLATSELFCGHREPYIQHQQGNMWLLCTRKKHWGERTNLNASGTCSYFLGNWCSWIDGKLLTKEPMEKLLFIIKNSMFCLWERGRIKSYIRLFPKWELWTTVRCATRSTQSLLPL